MKIQDTLWRIWSHEHQAWWSTNCLGYCRDRKTARLYPFATACELVASANYGLEQSPHEAMVLDCDYDQHKQVLKEIVNQ